MKKTLRIVSVLTVVLMLALTLASCGDNTLSGTYSATEEIMSVTVEKSYEFDGNNVTCKASGGVGVIGVNFDIAGTYEIVDDKITFTFENDDFNLGGTYSFSKDGDTITIDGETYTKK